VTESTDYPKRHRFPKVIISHAIYLYHRFTLSYRDVQELLFQRGIDVSHETIRAWCSKFGPDLAQAIRHYKPRFAHAWHLDEMRVVIGGVVHWLWRAINEQGDVLDVLLQKERDTRAAKRFFKRLLEDNELPERIITDGLRSYEAALKELPELAASSHIKVSAEERQNNLIEQSHRPTRDQEKQHRGFRSLIRTQGFLFCHAELNHLFRNTRSQTTSLIRKQNLANAFVFWSELSLSIP
jgi:putative transposase